MNVSEGRRHLDDIGPDQALGQEAVGAQHCLLTQHLALVEGAAIGIGAVKVIHERGAQLRGGIEMLRHE